MRTRKKMKNLKLMQVLFLLSALLSVPLTLVMPDPDLALIVASVGGLSLAGWMIARLVTWLESPTH